MQKIILNLAGRGSMPDPGRQFRMVDTLRYYMSNTVIQKAITINAPPDKVWRVFTEPAITRQLGGEYITEWKVGSDFGWKGLGGKMYTNGIILQLDPKKLIQHSLLNPEDKTVRSIITYKFEDTPGTTQLLAEENLTYEMSDKDFEEANEGWNIALTAVKEVAEKL